MRSPVFGSRRCCAWQRRRAQTEGRILRPTDGAALPSGETSIIATAPAGKLEIDGKPLAAEESAPGVFQAKVNLLTRGSYPGTELGGRPEANPFLRRT